MAGIKEKLLEFCWASVDAKTTRLKRQGAELQESLGSETKSSAGDKHETGRAMVQLEQEKLGNQLVELDRTRAILQKVDIAKESSKIVLGSLVKTSGADYFIAVSTGVYANEGASIFCISPRAPIAQLLLGKQKGDKFVFNGKEIEVLAVK